MFKHTNFRSKRREKRRKERKKTLVITLKAYVEKIFIHTSRLIIQRATKNEYKYYGYLIIQLSTYLQTITIEKKRLHYEEYTCYCNSISNIEHVMNKTKIE